MKLHNNRAVYFTPKDMDRFIGANIVGEKVNVIVLRTQSVTMKALHSREVTYGIPTYIAFINDEMWFYPIPDRDYELRLRYHVFKEV